ncbi:MAG: outer membrane beta-barrel protein [Pseudomonadota bacterium]
MNRFTKAGVACVAITVATASMVVSAQAGRNWLRSSHAAPSVAGFGGGGVGPCYFRADLGYSWDREPDVKWPVTSTTRTYSTDTNGDATIDDNDAVTSQTSTFVGDEVSNPSVESGLFGEAGFGCGSGSRGFRAEFMLGYRGDRKIDGVPLEYTVTNIFGTVPQTPDNLDDPLHTSLTSYTLMMNLYKDFGNFGGFNPYIGVGVGLAYHKLGETFFTGNPNLVNRIAGNSDVAFAWSLSAGVGYQISERAILDFGYRYIDLGSIKSGRVDSAGFQNPAVDIDDLTAHEIKIGLRYHFGGAAPVRVPLK